MPYIFASAIGQDSHRFCSDTKSEGRVLVLGGVQIPDAPALAGNSDADVVLHALTNAVSGLTGVNVLGYEADRLCLEQNITDSRAYLNLALAELGQWQLSHISISIEAAIPKLKPWISRIRESVAALAGLTIDSVGLTATTGEGLTDFGRGLGMQAFCLITAKKPQTDE